MKNYIGFHADRTVGRKIGGVITYITATEALDAEQQVAKSNSFVEYQHIHILKRGIFIIMCPVIQTALHKNLSIL